MLLLLAAVIPAMILLVQVYRADRLEKGADFHAVAGLVICGSDCGGAGLPGGAGGCVAVGAAPLSSESGGELVLEPALGARPDSTEARAGV